MPFMGVVHANARKVLANWVPHLPRRAHIICSGNFSLETTLRVNGYTGSITGCDVSVYTSSLGAYLAGSEIPLVMDFDEFPELSAMRDHLGDQEGRAACVALAFDVLKFVGRKNGFQNRMMDAYVRRLPELVEKTRERLRVKREAVRLDAYYAQDGMQRMREIPEGPDDVILTFPPTYSGDYENMYKKLDRLCMWAKPEYEDISGLVQFAREVVARPGPWIFGAEIPTPELEDVVGRPLSRTPRGSQKNIYLFSNLVQEPSVIRRDVSLSPTLYPRITEADEIRPDSKLEIFPIKSPEANYIRAVYIALTAVQCDGMFNFAVTLDRKVIGLLILQMSNKQQKFDGEAVAAENVIYMTADTAVSVDKYPRLSKLVLLASLSKELRYEVERRLVQQIDWVMTTAFSKHQVSMKYRGVFNLQKRAEDPDKPGITKLNYAARTGQHTLDEALQIWLKKHHKAPKGGGSE